MSTAWHPESDGQTERTNQTLKEYLRHYVNYQQDDWDRWLPLAEFAYNNMPSASTRLTPFFVNKAYHPCFDVRPTQDKHVTVASFKGRLLKVHQECRQALEKSMLQCKMCADRNRIPAPEYKAGDYVWLSTFRVQLKRPTQKLSQKRIGPFKILKMFTPLAARLELPLEYSRIHPVINVTRLEPARPSSIPGRQQPPPPPLEIDGEEQYEVQEVVSVRKVGRNRYKWKVYWKGYDDPSTFTDEPIEHLKNARDALAEFYAKNEGAPGATKASIDVATLAPRRSGRQKR